MENVGIMELLTMIKNNPRDCHEAIKAVLERLPEKGMKMFLFKLANICQNQLKRGVIRPRKGKKIQKMMMGH